MAVNRAVQLQPEGRHFLLCGDPAAAVEVVAAPAAEDVEALAFCLLDATPEAQATRLAARGDDPSTLRHHQAFASWMRHQAVNPLHMIEVVTTNGWDEMRWDRVPGLVPQWHVHRIDTTGASPDTVAADVLSWVQATLEGETQLVLPRALA